MRASFPALIAAVTILAGCGGVDRNRPTRVPVTGVVTHNDQPLADATVIFTPRTHEFGASGRTDAEGRFTLQTFDPGDGAVPGQFLVTVRKVEMVAASPRSNPEGDSGEGGDEGESSPPMTERWLIPEKFGRLDSSKLEAEVSESGPNDFRFELK